MERLKYITICLLTGFVWVSCTKAPVFQESLVPEIISITSIPETHSAVLMSDLNTAPYGRIECGFYIGTDKTNLRRVETALSGRNFTMLVKGLDEGTTYYFKAFISNGVNEIASGFESFITDTEPLEPALPVEPENPTEPEPEVPDEPEQPENPDNPEQPEEPSEPENPEQPEEPTEPEEPENPEQPTEPENPEEPENPDNPTDPEQPEEPENPSDPEEPTEPDNPTEPEVPDEPEEPEIPDNPEQPVEFTTEIVSLSVAVNDYIAELTAELSGDVSLVTECWFMAGFTSDNLSRIKGTIEGTSVKAYLAGLDSGTTLWYKAVISNGTEIKESEMKFYELD